jgi:hypothetical protein
MSTSRGGNYDIPSRPDEYPSRKNFEDPGESSSEHRQGMLDIANSFLNSPLMNQLSGMGGSSGLSLKESSAGLKKNYSSAKVGISYDTGRSASNQKSPMGKYDYDEEPRIYDTYHQQKFSDWAGHQKNDISKNHSYLKDSNNKKSFDYPIKESSKEDELIIDFSRTYSEGRDKFSSKQRFF